MAVLRAQWRGSTCKILGIVVAVHTDSRLEKECACVLVAEAAAAGMGSRPKAISSEVAQFTFNETGTEEAGAFEMSSFVSSFGFVSVMY